MAETEETTGDLTPDNQGTRRKVGKKLAIAVAVVAGVLGLGVAGAAYATFDYSNNYEGKFLPGTSVGGVEVAGMTPEAALRAVKHQIRPQLNRTITISFKEKSWTTSPRELGAHGDAERAVSEAMAVSEDASFMDRVGMRFLDDSLDFEREVAITYPGEGAKDLVAKLARKLNAKPRDAAIDYSTGWVEITEERTGIEVNTAKSVKNLSRALRGRRDSAKIEFKTTKPKVTSESFDQVLLVRHNERKVYLYENGKIARSWTVAVGQPGYPTPTGVYSVTELRYMPTWVNPAPDTWGADMPAEIGPGTSNPLGLRAINWSASGIRFHGTENIASLGTAASHGCVRMSNPDVIELYDVVKLGTPIVSTTLG